MAEELFLTKMISSLIISTGERSDTVTRLAGAMVEFGPGKIIRIMERSGRPVKGNPFEGKKGARPEIYSYGHRNVQGSGDFTL